jgi:hypothetical protein
MELKIGRPAFDVVVGTDAAKLIAFHAPPPVRPHIEELAHDAARTLLLREV